jgi:hypothetical protein
MPDDCPCLRNPLASQCGEWAGNESLCICADFGLAIEGTPAPS